MGDDGIENPLLAGIKVDARERRVDQTRSVIADNVVAEKIHVSAQSSLDDRWFYKFHPTLRQVLVFLGIYLGVGTLCFSSVRYHIEGHKTDGFLDAVYFCIVTMTTVGYSDLVPSSTTAKLLACVFVFAGMALVGLILCNAADYLVEKQELYFVRALHIRHRVSLSDIMRELESNRVLYKMVIITGTIFLLMVAGTVFLSEVENFNIVDAFYCVCSTITTLGYDDKSFSTKAGRVFAIFWILTSCICVALFFLYLAKWNTERKQRSLTKWVFTRRMTADDLEDADIDGNGVVSAAEFALFKLKEMGKISAEDISLLIHEFENLDVDNSGTLSLSDLATKPRR